MNLINNILNTVFKPKPTCPKEQELINFLEQNATLFGSRAWGVAKPNSDYDYLLSTITQVSVKGGKFINTFYNTFYVNCIFEYTFNGRKYQIIIPYKTYYNSTILANETMKSISKHLDFTNRKFRHSCFEQLVEFHYNQTLPTNKHLFSCLKSHFPELLI